MKKWTQFSRKVLSTILVCGLTIGMLPGQALQTKAAVLPVSEGMEELAQQVKESDDAFASEEGYALKTAPSKPEAFDLRERKAASCHRDWKMIRRNSIFPRSRLPGS